MKRAAGVLFCTPDNKVLLLKRAAPGDHAGEWSIPGGGLEGEETPEQAARREVLEETGVAYDGPLQHWTRRVKDDVDYTTYVAQIEEPLDIRLNDEHTEHQWVDRKAAVEHDLIAKHVHPGTRVSLQYFDMDELGIASAIAAGELASPVRYGNLMLIALRITGTGMSYRSADSEFVMRDPAHYMTDEFLARCNGLPVVLDHPDAKWLTTAEFKERIVGTIFLPYLKRETEEVWAVAKILDMGAAAMLEHEKLSTSPGVVFINEEDGQRVRTARGETILIEGKPSLLDHIAICLLGVWDKGGPASGVTNQLTHEDLKMDGDVKDKKDSEVEKKDAEISKVLTTMDAVMKACDSIRASHDAMSKKFDEWEKKEKEKEEKKDAEKAEMEAKEKDEKKDSDEEEKEEKIEAKDSDEEDEEALAKEREDNDLKKNDAIIMRDNADLRKQIADLARRLPAEVTAEVRQRMVGHQSKAERVAQAFGDSAGAPHFVGGESERDYRVRLLNKYKQHSQAFKDSDLTKVGEDESVFASVEEKIYNDAYSAALNPARIPENVLIPRVTQDATGRKITRFLGSPGACWNRFKMPYRYVKGWGDPKSGKMQNTF